MDDSARSVRTLPRVGPSVAAKLRRLGIRTISELVWYLPRSWVDLTRSSPIRPLVRGELGVVSATVRELRLERTRRRNMALLTAWLEDAAGDRIRAVWFNQPFLARRLTEGSQWVFWGTVTFDFGSRILTLQNPKFTGKPTILATYPETEGITSTQLRALIQPLLRELEVADYATTEWWAGRSLPDRTTALRAVHAPASSEQLRQARHRLALDELVHLVFRLQLQRDHRRMGVAPTVPTPVDTLTAWVRSLPFPLTNAQRRAAWMILKDLASSTPMARLLLGDVGSGKTVVGTMAAYATVLAGHRVVWLAPTQILAEQHLATLRQLLPSTAHPCLVTSASKPADLSTEQFLVGTHALLSLGPTLLTDVGLTIIDEQHRFGVKQRQVLSGRRPDGSRPHLLSMTATPIPRSLALTLFGDLDCSFLDERPVGRKPTITRVIQPEQRAQAYELVTAELSRGRQAYVVCPFIETPEASTQLPFDAQEQAVVTKAATIAKDARFQRFRVGALHGRLSAEEKQRTMQAFATNEVQLLVATSLVEVGIDVPNATVLVIEGADRFGLAQLHQLRGRVGRGDKQSLCVCIADDWSPVSQRRLAAFARSTDGFTLAALDLELRGPGDLLGELQAGLPPLKLARLTDTVLLTEARSIVAELRSDSIRTSQYERFLQELGSDGESPRSD